MMWKLLGAFALAALFIWLEYRNKGPWRRGMETAEVAVRFGIWVPWALGVFALLVWLAGVIAR